MYAASLVAVLPRMLASLEERTLARAQLGVAVLLYAAYSLARAGRAPRILGPASRPRSPACGRRHGSAPMASVFYAMFLDSRRTEPGEPSARRGSAIAARALSFARGVGYWLAGEFGAQILSGCSPPALAPDAGGHLPRAIA